MIADLNVVAQVAYAAGSELRTLNATGHTLTPWDDCPAYEKEAILSGVAYIANHPYDNQKAERFFEAYRDSLVSKGWAYGETVNEEDKLHPWVNHYSSISNEAKELFNLYALSTQSLTFIVS